MATTPTINDLVRDGRATPQQAALLFELQQEVADRDRKRRRGGVVAQFLVVIGAFVVAYFSRRR
jgi:hypothetical protein